MRKIRIENLTKADKSNHITKQRKHQVFLGNNVTVYFSDMKKAKAFLTVTNYFLNRKLFEINALYIDIFTEYRKAWFYSSGEYDRQMHFINDNFVFRDIEIIDRKFSLMVSRSHFENGSSIVWHGMYIIIECCESTIGKLTDLYKAKKHYAEAHQLNVIAERLGILKLQLDEYGKD